jgi:hypothetical protein
MALLSLIPSNQYSTTSLYIIIFPCTTKHMPN